MLGLLCLSLVPWLPYCTVIDFLSGMQSEENKGSRGNDAGGSSEPGTRWFYSFLFPKYIQCMLLYSWSFCAWLYFTFYFLGTQSPRKDGGGDDVSGISKSGT